MGNRSQTALVTGASSGIGRETATRLAKMDYEVIAAGRRLDRLNELATQFQRIMPMQVDLSDPEDTERFCRDLSGLPRPVTILINNAGYSIRGALEDVTLDALRRLFEVNVFSLIRVAQACLPGMRKQRRGTIVNLSSIVGKFPFPLSGVYATTKYAVEGITDALRMELAPFGIRVVAIRPGPIATEFNEVAGKMTGDLMARTDPDYKPVYQAFGAQAGKLFAGLSIPGPDLIANVIMEAVLSEAPKAAYCAGPFCDDLLAKRETLDDDAFYRMMMERLGLMGLRV
jgi:short-subunit dehydrogenase